MQRCTLGSSHLMRTQTPHAPHLNHILSFLSCASARAHPFIPFSTQVTILATKTRRVSLHSPTAPQASPVTTLAPTTISATRRRPLLRLRRPTALGSCVTRRSIPAWPAATPATSRSPVECTPRPVSPAWYGPVQPYRRICSVNRSAGGGCRSWLSAAPGSDFRASLLRLDLRAVPLFASAGGRHWAHLLVQVGLSRRIASKWRRAAVLQLASQLHPWPQQLRQQHLRAALQTL